jgi:hypothetical protein
MQQWPQPVDPLQTIRGEIENDLKEGNPHRALDNLRVKGASLPPAEQNSLARQATKNLLGKVDEWGAIPSFERVQLARLNARRLDPTVEFVLKCLEEDLEQRRLLESLKQLADWENSKEKVALIGPGAQLVLQKQKIPENIRKALKNLAEKFNQNQAAEALEQVVKDPTKSATLLGELSLDFLPENLRKLASGLKGVSGLLALRDTEERWWQWREPPDVSALKQAIADLKAGSGDSELAQRALQDLALKACLEGFPAEGKALLDASPGSPEHAAQLLADLRTLVLAEGKVKTWPAQRVLQDLERSPQGKSPPAPGVALLIRSELVKSWWNSGNLGKDAKAVPTSLDQIASLEEGYRSKLQPLVGPAASASFDQFVDASDKLKECRAGLEKDREALEAIVKAVEKLPGMARSLTAEERIAVYHYQRENLKKNQRKTAADIKKALHQVGLPLN